MIPDTQSHKLPVPAGTSEFETYTQLLRALLPRMTGVSIYNGGERSHLVERQ
jgi:hypothetical protein